MHPLAHMPQAEFDHLLWACDLNFVRGEDSLVRALWAGKPFIWHIYPQDDGAHLVKLGAFLDWLQAPADLRAAHAAWNSGAVPAPPAPEQTRPFALPERALSRTCVQAARTRLLAQQDLCSQLLGLVCNTHP
jgi:uncharacterized repeat protein (TIGR03837 family)